MTDRIFTRSGTNRGQVDVDQAKFHDSSDGSYDEAVAGHLWAWDTTALAWVKITVDPATGSVLVKDSADVKFAAISASASGVTQVVPAVVAKKIRVINYVVVASGTVNVKFQSHTVPTDKTGLLYLVANTGVSARDSYGLFETVAGEALDINLSGAVAVGGHLAYLEV